MKTFGIVALSSSLFLSSIFAAPFNKRELVVVTLTENVVHTVDVTTTVYVGADATPAGDSAPTTTSAGTTTTSSSTTSSLPAYVAPTTSTTPAYVAPTTSSTPAYVAPTTSSTPAYVAPTTTPSTTSTPVAAYTPPTTTSSQPAATPNTQVTGQKTGGSSTGGECSSSDAPCSGDITHYDTEHWRNPPALGACGSVNNGDLEDVIALPVGMMGDKSNGNPYCGRTVMISLDGKTASAKVVDKCMGCKGQSIDLSNHLFSQLGNPAVGRTQAKWWFTS